MNKHLLMVVISAGILGALPGNAQSVLFDFDSAPIHTPLPMDLTVGGITAHFSATGQGFSIQPADTMGFTPANFAGLCVYPSSIYAADLLISFSENLTNFSILYAPQELGCDDSARMRVTAYLDAALVGTSVTNASVPGTWPSEILGFSSTQSFNRIVVHYDQRPACGDWGPIFMADNMTVMPAPLPPPALQILSLGNQIQLSWPANAVGFTLQSALDLANTNVWITVTNLPVLIGNDNVLVLPIDTSNCFYRLRQL